MNERIKELITRVWGIPPDDFLEASWDFEENFAELIVKECAEAASNQVMDVEGNDWGVRWAVKNHFGVEE